MYYHDSVQKLSDRLALYKAHKEAPLHPTLSDDSWGAAYFYAVLLQQSKFLPDVLISRTRLDELAAHFKTAHGEPIDVEDLLQKDWLRIILGKVCIPYLTGSAVHLFERIAGFKEEFAFFDGLQPEQIKQIKTRDDLIQAAGGNDTLIFRTIDQTKNLFWYERNDRIELPRLDATRAIFREEATFRFLAELKKLMADNHLRISTTEFDGVYEQHSAAFTRTPTIDKIIETGMLELADDGNNYQLHLHGRSGIQRNALHERYSAILWQTLIEDDTFENDTQRLHFWYYRAIFHQGFLDVAGCITDALLNRFLDAAQETVLNDNDLASGKIEYFRLISDNNHTHELTFLWQPPEPPVELTSNKRSLYQIQAELGLLFDDQGMDVLVRQQCRHPLAYFIVQIVKADHIRVFNRLQAIFDQAENKPYPLWEATIMITHWRPELLPFMATRGQTVSLAYALMLKAELTTYTGEDGRKIQMSLVSDLTDLIMGYMAADHELDEATKANLLFECLLITSYRKFLIGRPGKEEDIQIAQMLRDSVVKTLVPGTHYNGSRQTKPLFIKEILGDLVIALENYQPVDRYKNGMLSLSFVQLDLALWLINAIDMANQSDRDFSADTLLEKVTIFFADTYLSVINATSISKKDYFGDKTIKPALPSWSDHRPNDRLIGWGKACLHLQEQDLLDDFIKPSSLKFSNSEDLYDEVNRFTAQKLRTHLFVLIDAYNTLFDDRRNLELANRPVGDILGKLEMRIKEIVVKYSVNDPAKRQVDIFSESFERWFSRHESKELLPVIAALINRFSASNRQAIIQALTQADQFIRALKMLDRIVSEKERSRLLKIITGRADFNDVLSHLSFQDMQFVTSALSQQDSFIELAEEALNHTEQAATSHTYNKNENQLFIFRMRLLHAYHKRDLKAIDAMPGPEQSHAHGQRFDKEDEKDFYRALIMMKTGRPEEAYDKYDQLASHTENDRPVIVLNRFAAKLQCAAETSDIGIRKQLAAEALAQWQQFDAMHKDKKNWPDIEDSILFDLLDAYEILEDYDNFDHIYSGIDIETRMRPDFLEIRVTVLLARQMQFAAEQLLTEAKSFHRLSDGGYPEFIEKLERQMNTPATISFLATQYDRISRLAPDDLIKLIPATENGGTDLAGFILNELTGAITDMLALINVLPDVDHEDKYSNLVMLSLNGRTRSYHWHAANIHSGFSDPERSIKLTDPVNPGLVDFAIMNGLQKLATCEALILEGKDAIDTQKHNLKIFNYDPARRLFYLLIYFKGGSAKFAKDWKKYNEVVEDFIEFPDGYALSAKVQPINQQIAHDGIRIGLSEHGDGTRLYHLFINVNYRLDLAKKTVADDKAAKKANVKNT